MNTGQMLFTILALALLSTLVLSMHRNFGESERVVLESKLGVTATSLASSIIEEASGKAFDEATDDNVATLTNTLTPVSKLGLEAGESYPELVNDFDDFNNLNLVQSFSQGGTFRIQCKVEYVDPANPEIAQSSQTWHKKLTVIVTSPDMPDTVVMHHIFSYWYFR